MFWLIIFWPGGYIFIILWWWKWCIIFIDKFPLSFIDISLVTVIDWIKVTYTSSSILNKLIPLSSLVWSITLVEFFWYAIYSLAFLAIHIFLIYSITWRCISFFLQSNEFIIWTFGTNIDTRKVWISYNIFTVVYICIIWFAIVDMLGNSSTSPPIRLE